VERNVTTFTESDFNRTFVPNITAGSDHAWGGIILLLEAPFRVAECLANFHSLSLVALMMHRLLAAGFLLLP
jgi:uncharacterized protein (DUF1501 family)